VEKEKIDLDTLFTGISIGFIVGIITITAIFTFTGVLQ